MNDKRPVVGHHERRARSEKNEFVIEREKRRRNPRSNGRKTHVRAQRKSQRKAQRRTPVKAQRNAERKAQRNAKKKKGREKCACKGA